MSAVVALPAVIGPMYRLGHRGVFGAAVLPGVMLIVFNETWAVVSVPARGHVVVHRGSAGRAVGRTSRDLVPRGLCGSGCRGGRPARVLHRVARGSFVIHEGGRANLQEALSDLVVRVLLQTRPQFDRDRALRRCGADVHARHRGCLRDALTRLPGLRRDGCSRLVRGAHRRGVPPRKRVVRQHAPRADGGADRGPVHAAGGGLGAPCLLLEAQGHRYLASQPFTVSRSREYVSRLSS